MMFGPMVAAWIDALYTSRIELWGVKAINESTIDKMADLSECVI